MSLIPTVQFSDFKKFKAGELKQMQSFEVISDGEYLCSVIIPPHTAGTTIVDTIKTEAEYLGNRSNTAGGKPPEEVMSKA